MTMFTTRVTQLSTVFTITFVSNVKSYLYTLVLLFEIEYPYYLILSIFHGFDRKQGRGGGESKISDDDGKVLIDFGPLVVGWSDYVTYWM